MLPSYYNMMKLMLKSLIGLLVLLRQASGFTFASITVDADSKIINTVTRYKFSFDRTQDDNLQATAYSSVAISQSDTATVTFPNAYTLSTVSCSVSINGGTPFTPTSCVVSGLKVVASGIVSSNTFVGSLVLWVNNILNPTPAIVTDYFYGTIGSDVSGVGSYASSMVLLPGTFASCYITFNPNIVNSTSDMILTIMPTNPISSAGSIRVQFPVSRKWTNDLSTTNNLPISASMSCSNKSSNVRSTFVCAGDSTAGVVASNLFAATVATSFSFSINNFLSPPTEQPSDPIIITSSVSGAQIDTCTTYVSNLIPKTMPSISISSSTGSAIVVNKQYLLRFTFTLADTIAQTDTLVLNFPAGSNLVFSTSTVTSNFGVYPLTATYDTNTLNLNLYMQNQARTFPAGSSLILTIGTYTAPPSIQPTSTFTLTFFQNGYKKMIGTTTLVASPSTLSGIAVMTATSVNMVTSYTFTITITDPLSSTGKIKIVVPTSIIIATSLTSCATLTGNGAGLGLTAFCSFNSAENSVTFSALNSTASVIGAQTITIVMNGLKNPASTAPTGVFNVFTYYKANDGSLVASGSIPGVTATIAFIASSQVAISASSYIVNDQVVSYSVQLTVFNPIAAGGYILIYIPGEISVNPSAISGQCSINVNSTSFVSTVCTAATPNATGVMVNFTNPFVVDMTVGTVFVARMSAVFTNPASTRPTSSFGLYTYHPNGFQIASVDTAVTTQMTTPDSFQSIAITRASHKNYDLTSYTFSVRQKSQFQPSSIILITFPNYVSTASPACSLLTPTATTLTCSYLSPTLRIVLPASTMAANATVTITVTNTRNPPSFAPAGSFGFISKTPGEAFQYSLGASTSSLSNNVASTFQSITYSFVPNTYGDAGSLKIYFDPSDSGVIPSYLRVTLANSFAIQTLSCNSFVDFIGSCASPLPYTIEVSGTFTSALMTFSITGFTNPLGAVSDFSSVISFDSNWFKLDESTNAIKFATSCSMPCKSCDPVNTSVCNSCYLNHAITTYVLYDSVLRSCYETCVDGKYANSTSFLCLACDTNCLTCTGNATFCLKCNSASTFKYLLIDTATFTQRCVSQCPATMYPESSLSPVTCKPCIAPCRECTSSSTCLSCVNGTYFYQNQCLGSCPSGIAVGNSGTNNCDFCDANCLTCAATTTTCTSCNASLLLYQNVCRTSCPSPLVPQNGTCGPCDSSCKTCTNNPYNCSSCDTSSALPYLLNNLCLAGCPETYYRNMGAGLCSLCSSVANLNCNNCSSVSTCLTCNTGFVFFQQNCLNYTPTGYVNISGIAVPCTGDCLYCSVSSSNCTSCQTLNYFNFQCLISCPSGYVPIAKVCQPCLAPCRTCSVTVDNCTTCLTTMNPPVYLSNNFCVQQCPTGSYSTQTNYTCQPCRSPCEYCSSLTSCVTCLNNFYLSGSSCLTVCPSGYTGVDRVCQICLGNCATCTDTTTKCTSCKTDTYFLASNFSCVASCGTGLFIDYLNRACVACSAPCKTCVNSTDTCLSCTTGILYNSQCLSQCPEKYFVQSNACNLCPGNCSSCISLVNCTSCSQSFVLYNGFCIYQCPPTHAVIINSVCTRCSTPNCHKCTSADFCTNCDSSYSLYNGACLGQCPSGFQTNGTHCLDTNQVTLTTSASFPVPFSIASVVVIIACLMSKLQFGHTFITGAIYSLLSICEVGSLGYFLYLYFVQSYFTVPLPFIVGVAAITYMYLLNLLALIVQNCSLCFDRDFTIWMSSRPHKSVAVLVNIIALLICHKFRNILFSKLFNLDIFTAKLDSTSKFKVMNVFSFLSLLHSGAAILAAVVAIISAEHLTQLFYACIDVIVVTSINALLAFFNVLKPIDYFYEKTADGFELKKRINADDDFYESKLESGGKAAEDEEGFPSNVYRTQVGGGLTNELLKVRESGSDDRDYSFGSLLQRNVEQVSVQAVQQLTEKQQEENNKQFSIVMATSTGKSAFMQSQKNGVSAQVAQRVYNQQIKNETSPSKRTVFYKEQPKQNYSKSDGEGMTQFNKKVTKAERSKKKIFDSSGEEGKSEQSKNILYKPDFKHNLYNKSTEEEYKPSSQIIQSSVKDAAVGSYKPVEFVEDERIDQNIQAGLFGSRDFLPFQSQQKLLNKNVIIEEEDEHEEVRKLEPRGKKTNYEDDIELVEDIKQYEKQLQGRIKNKKEEIEKMKSKIEVKEKSNSLLSQQRSGEVAEAGKLYRRGISLQEPIGSQKMEEKGRIIEKIEVVNEDGQRRTINVEFNDQASKRTHDMLEEQIMEDHQQQFIFDESNLPEEITMKCQEQEAGDMSKILAPEVNQTIVKQNHDEVVDHSSKLPTPSFVLNKPSGHLREAVKQDEIQKPSDIKNRHAQSQFLNQNSKQVNLTQNQISQNDKRQNRQTENDTKQRYQNKREAPVFDGTNSTPIRPYATIDAVPKKTSGHSNPLKNQNRFQYENEDKNISESGEDQFVFKRTQFAPPFQTDKEETEFHGSAIKSPNVTIVPRSRVATATDRSNAHSVELGSKSREKRSPTKQELQFGPNDREEQPYIEQSEPDSYYQGQDNPMRYTMMERPDNDDLKKYYERQGRKKSRDKPKRKPSESQIHAQKIYMQRQEVGKKWK